MEWKSHIFLRGIITELLTVNGFVLHLLCAGSNVIDLSYMKSKFVWLNAEQLGGGGGGNHIIILIRFQR